MASSEGEQDGYWGLGGEMEVGEVTNSVSCICVGGMCVKSCIGEEAE